MTTPIYKGVAQPDANRGWLSNLGSWFAGSVPAYAGRGQAAPGSSGYFGGATPAYKTASTSAADGPLAVAATDCAAEPERITVLIPRDLIEQQE
jgi:hypothetical protein